MMEVKIADLTWSPFIYPRGGRSEETVKAYVEALRVGATFPPIKVQRVFNYHKDNEKVEAILILDGIHRWSAFNECGYKTIAAIEWKQGPIDFETNQIPLLLESAQYNLTHGDRLSPKDKKRIARDIASSDPDCKWTEGTLAQKLGVIQQTVNTYQGSPEDRQECGHHSLKPSWLDAGADSGSGEAESKQGLRNYRKYQFW
jgi:hypothetical protein